MRKSESCANMGTRSFPEVEVASITKRLGENLSVLRYVPKESRVQWIHFRSKMAEYLVCANYFQGRSKKVRFRLGYSVKTQYIFWEAEKPTMDMTTEGCWELLMKISHNKLCESPWNCYSSIPEKLYFWIFLLGLIFSVGLRGNHFSNKDKGQHDLQTC